MIRKRCAIYTRKSTDEGLDQSFNSLDAQREACEAYVTSQRHEGWSLVKKAYNDGGFSGGSMERPALLSLLNDIRAGLVDIVVVYKIDRLTRSLADFAKMVEVFDAKGVSFVSVTQQFNTTTSMGRLTLNVLLSFAQFEREVTAERIRDKIAASRKKGMWMGGPPPLGYDVRDKKLVINSTEAEQVRRLFVAYLELGSVRALKVWVAQNGITTKIRTSSDGTFRSGGKPFSRGNLHALLRYRTYIGEVQHRGQVYPGEQEAIISAELWGQVQAKLVEGWSSEISARHDGATPMLLGLAFDETGDRLTPTHATKTGRRYHYYVSSRLIEKDKGNQDGWRLPAHKLEQAVRDCLLSFLSDKVAVLDAANQQDGNFGTAASAMNQILKNANKLIEKIRSSSQLESAHEVTINSCSGRDMGQSNSQVDSAPRHAGFMARGRRSLDLNDHNAAADIANEMPHTTRSAPDGQAAWR